MPFVDLCLLMILQAEGAARAFVVFFFKQKTAYEISACLVGSEMCIRDRRERKREEEVRSVRKMHTCNIHEMRVHLDSVYVEGEETTCVGVMGHG